MRPAEDTGAAVERVRKRSRIVVTLVMLVALAVVTATLIGAFRVVDERASQAFRTDSRVTYDVRKRTSPADTSRTANARSATAGGASASPRMSGPPAVSQPATTGESGPAPPDAQEDGHKSSHHHRRRHHRH